MFVLIADADNLFTRQLQALCAAQGICSKIVSDNDALEQIADEVKPDAVLVHLEMLEQPAVNPSKTFRDIFKRKNVPVFAMTACRNLVSQRRAENCGADRLLNKPINIRELASHLANNDDNGEVQACQA